MIPSSFEYHRPTSLDEAVSLLQEHGDDASLLAGGHSLLPAMKLRLSTPGALIDRLLATGFRHEREPKLANLEDVFISATGRSLREE